MAIPLSAFSTYGVGYPYSNSATGITSNIGTREDAMNTLTMIDPDEAMTLAVLGRTTTNGLRHEWFTDTLTATSTAGALQGEDWNSGLVTASGSNLKGLTKRKRIANFVQWFRQDWSITTDELMLSQRGQLFGVPDELSYQTGKAGQELNRNIDARLWALGSATWGPDPGSDTAAATFGTFRYWGQTSGICATAGTATVNSFTTAAFYQLHESMWTAGAKPDTIFVSPGVKSDISRILLGDTSYPTTQSGTQGIPAVSNANVVQGGEYGPVIDFIRTDFGRVAMVVDRWLPQAAAGVTATANYSENPAMFLVEKAKLRVAWWRPIKPYQVASTGDNVKMYVLGACTTEVLHPTAIGLLGNVNT